MSVIIRLQNLPWAANAADIRQYFQGLSIPEGGVHIVGGEKGDAFISFSTDEDARQAMLADGGCIKEVQIRLLLSSRNEMQKVIETARQQAMQLTQVYMQQMQQPQLTAAAIAGSLQPPLTAKVLPQPQQQPVRPDRLQASLLHRNPPITDPASAMLMSQDKLQQQPEIRDRDDKSLKRERTRSRSRDRRSKSSRSGGGSSSRRDRSRSRDRRRRDRSRGRDRSRDRHRGSEDRNSSSRGRGDKSNRSRSPGKTAVNDQQARPWSYRYDGVQQQQIDSSQTTLTAMNAGGPGPMFSQFRAPPQPPVIHPALNSNSYQPQQQKQAVNEWRPPMQGVERQHHPPYYGDGSDDDEDDRQTEFENNAPYRKYNNNVAIRRGPPGQDFNKQQQGFGGRGGGPRFNKSPLQQPGPGGSHQLNRGGGGQRPYGDFGGGRFNNHQQQPRYKASDGTDDQLGVPDGGIRGGRPSRFSSIHEGGRPSRFNQVQRRDGDTGAEFNDPKRPPLRFNDRYRYDVRNSQASPAQSDGTCVEVNTMSSHVSYGDVRKIFEGIHIDGSAIKIQKHRQGVAFVRFDSNHSKILAMQVNGSAYKGNAVEVKHLDDVAYERENTDDRPYPSVPPAPTVVVDHVDLVDDDVTPPPSSATTDCNTDKNSSVDGKSGGAADPVKGKNSGAKDATTVEDDGSSKKQTASQQDHQPTKFLRLQQLPVTVTEEDVLNEIDGGGEVRRVMFHSDGEFKGAVLEFHSVDAAENALKKFDCVLLGSTPVPVLRCTYKEYSQIKRNSAVDRSGSGGKRFSNDGGRHHHNPQHSPGNSPTLLQPPPPPTGIVPPITRTNCVYLYGLPNTVTNTDITQFFSDTSVLPDKIHIMLSKFGRPTGESYCEFSTAQHANIALSKDQTYMGPSLVYVEAISRQDMIQAITKPMQQRNHQQELWSGGMRPPRHHSMMQSAPRHLQGAPFGGNGPVYGGGRFISNGGGRGGAGYTPRMRGPGPGPNTGPDGFGQPGCVVALENVPYRADVQEIVEFFEGFDLNSQNVIRRFNDFGKPTGEARVNLRNPQEALRAVRALQNKSIFNRPVRLQLL